MNEVAKALHDGLDILRERGWSKWLLCDEATGRVCARGAVLVGAQMPATLHSFRQSAPLAEADRLLCQVSLDQYPDRSEGWAPDAIAYVNNHDDSTIEDIERIFEKAIVRSYEMDAESVQ